MGARGLTVKRANQSTDRVYIQEFSSQQEDWKPSNSQQGPGLFPAPGGKEDTTINHEMNQTKKFLGLLLALDWMHSVTSETDSFAK